MVVFSTTVDIEERLSNLVDPASDLKLSLDSDLDNANGIELFRTWRRPSSPSTLPLGVVDLDMEDLITSAKFSPGTGMEDRRRICGDMIGESTGEIGALSNSLTMLPGASFCGETGEPRRSGVANASESLSR